MAGLLAIPKPASQPFAGNFSGEPPGWFLNAKDGRPLKAYRSAISGWLYHTDFHQGVDQYGALGTPLPALEAGTVDFAGILNSTGVKVARVLIQGHSNVRFSLAHCDQVLVHVGQKVTRGQTIAKMGKTGNASGVHVHTQVEIYENGRWVNYDLARFTPANSIKMGPYTYPGIPANSFLHGGDLIYDDRIYPIRGITINDATNVRTLPDTTSPVVLLTTGVTPATQLNEIPGAPYTLAGVTGTLWAKVKLTDGRLGFVAKPLIKPA